jgi:hypothetical protein
MENGTGGDVHAKPRPWQVSTLVLKKAAWHVEAMGAGDGLQHNAAKLQLAVGHMICSGLSETGTPCGHVKPAHVWAQHVLALHPGLRPDDVGKHATPTLRNGQLQMQQIAE